MTDSRELRSVILHRKAETDELTLWHVFRRADRAYLGFVQERPGTETDPATYTVFGSVVYMTLFQVYESLEAAQTALLSGAEGQASPDWAYRYQELH